MTKKEFVVSVAQSAEFTQKDVSEVLDTMIETIIGAVASGDEVAIAGLGKFTVAERAERAGRNPQTGEAITIAASKSPKFKAAKQFKDAVNA